MITIREKLIKIRSDSGLSQQDFAEKLNISRQTVTRWESGKSTPSSAQILNICREFGLDANELLSGEHAAVKTAPTQKETYNRKNIQLERYRWKHAFFISVFLLIIVVHNRLLYRDYMTRKQFLQEQPCYNLVTIALQNKKDGKFRLPQSRFPS